MLADRKILNAAMTFQPPDAPHHTHQDNQPPHTRTEAELDEGVYLVTEDINLKVLAGIHKVPVFGLGALRAGLVERERIWEMVYGQQRASDALQQAQCMGRNG
jgi:hypothetical protein